MALRPVSLYALHWPFLVEIFLLPTERSKIGEECLNTGKDKQDPAQRLPSVRSITDEIMASKVRRERFQHTVIEKNEVLQ